MKFKSVFSSFSAKDLSAIKEFYTSKLGLEIAFEMNGMIAFKLSDNQEFFVYSAPHEPASYTVMNFRVDNIDTAAKELKEKGVKFEMYDEMNQDKEGISRDENMNIAWFKDPQGNILAIIEEK